MKTDCRNFSGYRPCKIESVCDNCQSYSPIKASILIVHLGAIGAVVRSTSLLAKIREKYPQSFITWITDRPSEQLLKNHPLIDQVCSSENAEILSLQARIFDIALVIDKSAKAIGIAHRLECQQIIGFTQQPSTGAILPANAEAEELWSLGLDNHKKFFINKKSEVQLIAEALKLVKSADYKPEEFCYSMPLDVNENMLAASLRNQWQQDKRQPIIGLNTGCSNVIAAKKLTVEYNRNLIKKLISSGHRNIVLLGGPEDTQRNQQIAYGLNVIESPTQLGLRNGMVSVAACDIVVTGDSLGMHMAIAQNKFVIAWFGPTCAQEIELYGKGIKILSSAACSPCWKRSCEMQTMCYDQVEINSFMTAVEVGTKQWQQEQIQDYPKQEL